MFSIAAQSVQLRSADDLKAMRDGDEPSGNAVTLTFQTYDADTSKCVLEASDADGNIHRITFNKGGLMITQTMQEAPDEDGNPGEATDLGASQVVPGTGFGRNVTNALPVTERTRMRPNEGSPQTDPFGKRLTKEQNDELQDSMRDPTADDPYAYKAPVPADVAQRGDVTPGNTAPAVANGNADRVNGSPNYPAASSPLPGSPPPSPNLAGDPNTTRAVVETDEQRAERQEREKALVDEYNAAKKDSQAQAERDASERREKNKLDANAKREPA